MAFFFPSSVILRIYLAKPKCLKQNQSTPQWHLPPVYRPMKENLFPNHTLFHSTVGALQYLSITHPNSAFAVNKLSQFMHKQTQTHWQSVKRLLRYLKSTIQFGLHIYCSSCNTLQSFSDVDQTRNKDDRRSIGSFCIFLGKNLISWSCRKQATLARSNIEVEYNALANTAAELKWLQSLFQELSAKPSYLVM